ncbi:hypothetical protein C2845_PM18G05710 [Panicum miliaceum]|uniref:Protein FAR1-RELATED SEQUENCE n=1 Tax=Panicum miliaceum TaxID=4540 RepID=A0A3L6PJD2_PANMI|nr:hypothetical protein C2845_PM18G05710 [Panicum miliaceum]
MQILHDMRAKDNRMTVKFKLDKEGKLTSMLWSTGKNKDDYERFGDAITFDKTYRTNLYKLPFGLFVGVNNHFQSVIFGGLLLTTEMTEDFEWGFSNFVDIMGGKAPQTMLTDQCAAMAKAMKTTPPDTRHRWCRWHVLRKAKQKIGSVYTKYSGFKGNFRKLITEETCKRQFELKWQRMIRTYKLEKNKFMTRLYRYRLRRAKPYFMGVFCAGMTSTQRSESANYMLKQINQRSAPMHVFVSKLNELQVQTGK